MVPHILDTIIFVKDGEVKEVLEVTLLVKVPTGMTEADLARPVVEVKDFETGKLEFEIYTFGEENIVIPISATTQTVSPLKALARERILQEIRKFDPTAEVELTSDTNAIVRVENRIVPRIIGKDGIIVNELQKKLGIHIDIEPKIVALGKEINYKIDESGNSISFEFEKRMIEKTAGFYLEDKFLFSATIGKKAAIKVSKDSDVGRELLRTIVGRRKIKVLV
jgi:ATPase